MKHLILMRHAKSNWDEASVPDHERPLSGRGRRAAPAMAEWLLEHDFLPDLVLCSTSARTRETWSLVEGVIESRALVEFVEELYLAAPQTMIERVRELGGQADCVLMIGHNPGTHELACDLASQGPDAMIDRLDNGFPTAAIARFAVEAETWNSVGARGLVLTDFVQPKDLRDAGKRGL